MGVTSHASMLAESITALHRSTHVVVSNTDEPPTPNRDNSQNIPASRSNESGLHGPNAGKASSGVSGISWIVLVRERSDLVRLG